MTVGTAGCWFNGREKIVCYTLLQWNTIKFNVLTSLSMNISRWRENVDRHTTDKSSIEFRIDEDSRWSAFPRAIIQLVLLYLFYGSRRFCFLSHPLATTFNWQIVSSATLESKPFHYWHSIPSFKFQMDCDEKFISSLLGTWLLVWWMQRKNFLLNSIARSPVWK